MYEEMQAGNLTCINGEYDFCSDTGVNPNNAAEPLPYGHQAN